jgi:hypothetical protein
MKLLTLSSYSPTLIIQPLDILLVVDMPRGTFLTPEEKTTLDALHLANWSLHSMANHIKRSGNAVRLYLKDPKKYGLKSH